jgi:hypothetical protein
MAIVRNKGNSATPVDKSYVVPNRYNVVNPCTPLYAGEIVTGIVGIGTGATWGAYVSTSLDPYSWIPYTVGQALNEM